MATSQGGSVTIIDAAWHPVISLATVQVYDPSVAALIFCVVLPSGWTGPGAGPPAGTGIAGSGTITLLASPSASAAEHVLTPPPPAPANHGRRSAHA
jgi:hypothetical protein